VTSPTKLSKRSLFRDLGYEPHPGQWEIHNSAHSRRVVACGVRWGKTTCAAMEGIAAAMQPAEQSVGWVCAPTYDLADRVFREVQRVALEKLQHRVVFARESERRIALRNMAGGISEIRAKSADNPVSLLGEGLDWLIVDEASRLKPSIWQGHLSQRLIDKHGWALLISTPKGKGYFYDLYRRGQGSDAEFKSWNYPSASNPMLDGVVIEAERARLPSGVFRQEYGAEFLEGAGAVFRNVRDCAIGTFEEPRPNERYYAGLDLARIEDFTVLVVIDRKFRVVFVDRFNRIDWALQVQRVGEATRRYNSAVVYVDSTGKGEPVLESLRLANIYCQAYSFTMKSKAALIDSLALVLEKKEIVLPKPELWPEGIEELEAFEYSVSDMGNVRSGAPSGTHDDCVIALALAAWPLGPAHRRGTLSIGRFYSR